MLDIRAGDRTKIDVRPRKNGEKAQDLIDYIDQFRKINPSIDVNDLENRILLRNNPQVVHFFHKETTCEQEKQIIELLKDRVDDVDRVWCFRDHFYGIKEGFYYSENATWNSKYKIRIRIPCFVICISQNEYIFSDCRFGYSGAGPAMIRNILHFVGIPDDLLGPVEDPYNKDYNTLIFTRMDSGWFRNK